MGAGEIGCCVFLRRPSSRRYRLLTDDQSDGDFSPAAEVRVVAGRRDRREFLVDPFVLEMEPFKILLEMVNGGGNRRDDAIFVDVDAMFFEHMLWSFYNASESSSSAPLFQLNLRDIIDFYSQDS